MKSFYALFITLFILALIAKPLPGIIKKFSPNVNATVIHSMNGMLLGLSIFFVVWTVVAICLTIAPH